jgi:hypothetical protein
MGRIANTLTDIQTVDLTLTTSTFITLSTSFDAREALSGALHIKFKTTTGAASKTLKVYLMGSKDNVTFDDGDSTLLTELASFALPNNTNDHNVTLPLDGVTLSANYYKVGLLCDAASNYGVLRSLTASIRKPV